MSVHICELLQVMTIKDVSERFQMHWHTVKEIEKEYLKKKHDHINIKGVEYIAIDEFAIQKGHKYMTVVMDLKSSKILYVGDGRAANCLDGFWLKIRKYKSNIKAVAMDMWDPYIAATKAWVPKADEKIVFDRYHVMRMILTAVDKVRKQEHRELLAQNIDLLKGTKYLWLWNEENIPQYRRDEFEELRSRDLKVCRARAIKDNLRHLWNYRKTGWMRHFFNDWFSWAVRSRLQPIVKAARSIKAHLENIITYAKQRITNALGESLNSKIEKVKRLACGYRNRAHYRTAIFFHCGGLDLYPKRTDSPLQIIAA